MTRGALDFAKWNVAWVGALSTAIACGANDPIASTSDAGASTSSVVVGAGAAGGGGVSPSGTGIGGGGAAGGGGAGGIEVDGGSDGSMRPDTGHDGNVAEGGEAGESGGCAMPDPDPTWITPYQSDIVARLSGQIEAMPGTRLANRGTAANRQAARAYIGTVFQAIGMVPLEQNYTTGTNVYADLKGTSGAPPYVVLGAHYDSVPQSPGANDNASGVAVVLAAARYLAGLPCRTKSFTFVLFDEEEVGFVGSRNFASKLKTDSIAVHSVHTVDQMGWDQNDDRMIELELPDMGLAELYRTAVAELGVSIPIKTTLTNSTDHVSFRPTFLATGVTEGYTSGDTTPYYHMAGDTYDTVKFAYLKSSTVLVNRVMADLAR